MNASSKPRRHLLVPFGGLVLLATAMGWYWAQSQVSTPPRETPSIRPPVIDRQQIFREHVEPVLESHVSVNRDSMERCVARIRDRFREHRDGVDPFVEDITSTWTRLGVLQRMPVDWWKQDGRTESYIQEKFEKHLFSEGQLQQEISEALLQLREDLRADRAQLLTKIKVSISASELPDVSIPENVEFDRSVQAVLQDFATRRATDSVYHGIATLIASDVATTVAAAMVTRVVTSVGTSVAVSATAAGGSTAGSAAAGAGGGSLAGPAGTAIGLGAGLVIGVGVDWWMTDRFRQELKMEMTSYLFRLEHGILFGEKGNRGLESDLETLLQDLSEAQKEVLAKKLLVNETL